VTTAREALELAKDKTFRAVFIDLVIPDVNSVALMNQIRAFQPGAAMVALALRTTNDISAEVKGQGFKDFLFKPFDAGALEDLLAKHLELDDVLAVDGNVMVCTAFTGKDERLDRYFTRLRKSARDAFEKLASACYDDAIVHVGDLPPRPDRVMRAVVEMARDAKALGIALRLVGTPEIKKQFSQITDVATLPFYASVDEARAAA
jgi:CheY-like chemotaxis protein